MAAQKDLDQLTHSILKSLPVASSRTSFYATSNMPAFDPGIVVQKFGPLKLPLAPKDAKRLVKICRQAPYGKGTETLVDTSVRKTFELDPAQFTLGAHWQRLIDVAVVEAAIRLGLPQAELEASLYKLLVYEQGGFFLPHQDSEKLDGMVASLVVVLPSRFQGGELNIVHQGQTVAIDFAVAARGEAPCYARG